MKLNALSRDLYRASKLTGDLNALQRGRLPQRVIKRVYHRKLIGLLRRGRVW
jgi:hypothetical protein